MPKGFYTQGFVVLLKEPIEIADVEPLMSDFNIVKRWPTFENWEFRGPSFALEYQPEVNGYACVDVISRRWPDHMGDNEKEQMLFGAWLMGRFGPFAFPDGLARASQQTSWSDGAEVMSNHRAFMRIRLGYCFGVDDDAPVIPEGYDPVAELTFLNAVVQQLLKHPAVLCYFNPNGEVLLPRELLEASVRYHAENGLLPFDSWVNLRLVPFDDTWCVMDSVGNWQLDIPDQEVVFTSELLEPNQAAKFIRYASAYLVENGAVIDSGDTMNGPDGADWQVWYCERGVAIPPRGTLRWLPVGSPVPPELAGAAQDAV